MKYNKGAILRSIEQPFVRTDVPHFDTGDTVRVDYKVVEGNRSRIQSFEGVVIAKKNGKGARATMTVRKVSFGEGVERVFPISSPLIDKIEIVRRGRTRRSKLYYMRELRGKAARLQVDVRRQEEDRAAARVAREDAKVAEAAAAVAAAEAAAAAEAEAAAAAEAEAAAAEAAAAEAAAAEAEAAAAAEAAATEEVAEPEVEAAAEEEAPAEEPAAAEVAAEEEAVPAEEAPVEAAETEEVVEEAAAEAAEEEAVASEEASSEDEEETKDA